MSEVAKANAVANSVSSKDSTDLEKIRVSSSRSIGSLEREITSVLSHATAVTALHAAHARGRNHHKFAGQLAANAMRRALNKELPVRAEIVIGEEHSDEVPTLSAGEQLGPEDAGEEAQLMIAVDPLEGTNLCARGEPGAITVVAAALKGQGEFLRGAQGYFDKIVIGSDLAERVRHMKKRNGPYIYIKVDDERGLIDNPVEDVIRWIAHVRQKAVSEVVAMVLERERNAELIARLRALNAQVLLISDGDTTAGLLALDTKRDVDVALGVGAAPEGVLTAAICRVFGGYMEARWQLDGSPASDAIRADLKTKNIDPEKLLCVEDLASGHIMFSLTGVTYNQYTPGVQYLAGGTAVTHTIYGRSRSGTIYERRAIHQNPPPQPQYPSGDK